MVHQLGRTELENLAPPERIFFGRTRLSFGRKKVLAPPKKCPKNAYVTHYTLVTMWTLEILWDLKIELNQTVI